MTSVVGKEPELVEAGLDLGGPLKSLGRVLKGSWKGPSSTPNLNKVPSRVMGILC